MVGVGEKGLRIAVSAQPRSSICQGRSVAGRSAGSRSGGRGGVGWTGAGWSGVKGRPGAHEDGHDGDGLGAGDGGSASRERRTAQQRRRGPAQHRRDRPTAPLLKNTPRQLGLQCHANISQGLPRSVPVRAPKVDYIQNHLSTIPSPLLAPVAHAGPRPTVRQAKMRHCLGPKTYQSRAGRVSSGPDTVRGCSGGRCLGLLPPPPPTALCPAPG
eukprot:COSAG04_NODE_1023_length_8708_cov_40.249506_4_plen_214_part_00